MTTNVINTTFLGDGDGGDITISSQGDIITGELLSATLSGTPGNIKITSNEGSLTINSGLLIDDLISRCEANFICQSSGNTITIAREFKVEGKTLLFGAKLSGTIEVSVSTNSASNSETPVSPEPETPVAPEPETPVAPEPETPTGNSCSFRTGNFRT